MYLLTVVVFQISIALLISIIYFIIYFALLALAIKLAKKKHAVKINVLRYKTYLIILGVIIFIDSLVKALSVLDAYKINTSYYRRVIGPLLYDTKEWISIPLILSIVKGPIILIQWIYSYISKYFICYSNLYVHWLKTFYLIDSETWNKNYLVFRDHLPYMSYLPKLTRSKFTYRLMYYSSMACLNVEKRYKGWRVKDYLGENAGKIVLNLKNYAEVVSVSAVSSYERFINYLNISFGFKQPEKRVRLVSQNNNISTIINFFCICYYGLLAIKVGKAISSTLNNLLDLIYSKKIRLILRSKCENNEGTLEIKEKCLKQYNFKDYIPYLCAILFPQKIVFFVISGLQIITDREEMCRLVTTAIGILFYPFDNIYIFGNELKPLITNMLIEGIKTVPTFYTILLAMALAKILEYLTLICYQSLNFFLRGLVKTKNNLDNFNKDPFTSVTKGSLYNYTATNTADIESLASQDKKPRPQLSTDFPDSRLNSELILNNWWAKLHYNYLAYSLLMFNFLIAYYFSYNIYCNSRLADVIRLIIMLDMRPIFTFLLILVFWNYKPILNKLEEGKTSAEHALIYCIWLLWAINVKNFILLFIVYLVNTTLLNNKMFKMFDLFEEPETQLFLITEVAES